MGRASWPRPQPARRLGRARQTAAWLARRGLRGACARAPAPSARGARAARATCGPQRKQERVQQRQRGAGDAGHRKERHRGRPGGARRVPAERGRRAGGLGPWLGARGSARYEGGAQAAVAQAERQLRGLRREEPGWDAGMPWRSRSLQCTDAVYQPGAPSIGSFPASAMPGTAACGSLVDPARLHCIRADVIAPPRTWPCP